MLISALTAEIEYNLENFDVPEDTDMVDLVNRAFNFVCTKAADLGLPAFLAETSITNGADEPADFIKFVPENGWPVRRIGGKFYLRPGAPSSVVATYGKLFQVEDEDDTFPLPVLYRNAVLTAATMYGKGKSDEEISAEFDLKLLSL
jgi:hypothetical protein